MENHGKSTIWVDEFPIENGDFPASHSILSERVSNWIPTKDQKNAVKWHLYGTKCVHQCKFSHILQPKLPM